MNKAKYKEFEKVAKKVGKDLIVTPIHKVRSGLNWDRDYFNNFLFELSNEGIIQLTQGNPSSITNKQVEDSYLDEYDNLFINFMWS